jgi:hypothetical protein
MSILSYYIIIFTTFFAFFKTLGLTTCTPLFMVLLYHFIKKEKTTAQNSGVKTEIQVFVFSFLCVGILFWDPILYRDSEFYLIITEANHSKGVESVNSIRSLDLYHHFDLWVITIFTQFVQLRNLVFNTPSLVGIFFIALFILEVYNFIIYSSTKTTNRLNYNSYLTILSLVIFLLYLFNTNFTNLFTSNNPTVFFAMDQNGPKFGIFLWSYFVYFRILNIKSNKNITIATLLLVTINPIINTIFIISILPITVFSKKSSTISNTFSWKISLGIILFWAFFIFSKFIKPSGINQQLSYFELSGINTLSIKTIITEIWFYFRWNLHFLFSYFLSIVIINITHLKLKTNHKIVLYSNSLIVIYMLLHGYLGFRIVDSMQVFLIPMSICTFIAIFLILIPYLTNLTSFVNRPTKCTE